MARRSLRLRSFGHSGLRRPQAGVSGILKASVSTAFNASIPCAHEWLLHATPAVRMHTHYPGLRRNAPYFFSCVVFSGKSVSALSGPSCLNTNARIRDIMKTTRNLTMSSTCPSDTKCYLTQFGHMDHNCRLCSRDVWVPGGL